MQTSLGKLHLLNTDEAAKFIGVSAQTMVVWRCLARYKIPYIKIGRLVRYREDDLREWMESRTVRQAEVNHVR